MTEPEAAFSNPSGVSYLKHDRLQSFIRVVTDMEGNRFYPNCLHATLGLDVDDTVFRLDALDRDALKSFLVTFRRFLLQNDPCRFDVVLEDAKMYFAGTKTERWLLLSEKRISHACTVGGPMEMPRHKPVDLFRLWTCGDPAMFHDDAVKSSRWQTFPSKPNMRAAAQAMVLQFAWKMSRELIYLKRLLSPLSHTEPLPNIVCLHMSDQIQITARRS